MAQKQNSSPKVKNAGGRRGTQPGDKPVRRGHVKKGQEKLELSIASAPRDPNANSRQTAAQKAAALQEKLSKGITTALELLKEHAPSYELSTDISTLEDYLRYLYTGKTSYIRRAVDSDLLFIRRIFALSCKRASMSGAHAQQAAWYRDIVNHLPWRDGMYHLDGESTGEPVEENSTATTGTERRRPAPKFNQATPKVSFHQKQADLAKTLLSPELEGLARTVADKILDLYPTAKSRSDASRTTVAVEATKATLTDEEGRRHKAIGLGMSKARKALAEAFEQLNSSTKSNETEPLAKSA